MAFESIFHLAFGGREQLNWRRPFSFSAKLAQSYYYPLISTTATRSQIQILLYSGSTSSSCGLQQQQQQREQHKREKGSLSLKPVA